MAGSLGNAEYEQKLQTEAAAAVSASIGVAPYKDDGPTADALLKSADEAMYMVKKAAKNRYRIAGNLEEGDVRVDRLEAAGRITSGESSK